MYAAPPVIESEVFARVCEPHRARSTNRLQSGVARGSFLEGPSFGTIPQARAGVAGKRMYSHM